MQSDVIRVYKTVHTWTGIVAGLALFIAFYAGAVTMFKDELADWVTPPAARAASVPLADANALIGEMLAAYPETKKQFSLKLDAPGEIGEAGEARAASAQPQRATLMWQARGRAQRFTASRDAAGHLAVAQSAPSDAARFIDILHMTAGVPGPINVGMTAMGVVSLLYGLALVSGVIVLLPTLVKDLFVVRVGKNLKRMWLDAHNVIGILSLPFHVVIALTAVGFGLHDYLYKAQDPVIYGGRLEASMKANNPFFGPAPKAGETAAPAPLLPPERLLAILRERAPGFVPEEMSYRRAGSADATVFVRGDDPRYLALGGGFALLNAADGRVISGEFLPGAGNAWSGVTGALYALHFGSYGGEPVRWAYFFLGLAGAFLFYSGNLLWIESRRRAERREGGPVAQRRSTRLMAAGTVGVALGCICGISLTLVAGRALAGHVADLQAWHRWIYYGVFLGSIGWAFARGAARASVELLGLAAVSTAMIPAVSALGWLLPSVFSWGSAASASASASGNGAGAGALGVEIGGAIGAACFAWMMKKTARRVSAGRADSVWSGRGKPDQKSVVTESRNVRGAP